MSHRTPATIKDKKVSLISDQRNSAQRHHRTPKVDKNNKFPESPEIRGKIKYESAVRRPNEVRSLGEEYSP